MDTTAISTPARQHGVARYVTGLALVGLALVSAGEAASRLPHRAGVPSAVAHTNASPFADREFDARMRVLPDELPPWY